MAKEIFVVNCFHNRGWGMRFDNHDVLETTLVKTSKKEAWQACEDYVNAGGGQWLSSSEYSNGSRTAKIQQFEV